MSEQITFPPEPSIEPIRGRAATTEDCSQGRAAFAADGPSPELSNVPLDVFLPRVANVIDDSGAKTPVVLIQAEVARVPANLAVVGFEDAAGNFGACTTAEIEPWNAFFLFYNNPEVSLETLQAQFPNRFSRQGKTLATQPYSDDDPVLFVRHHAGDFVTRQARAVAADSEHAEVMSRCDACLIVFFEDLEHVLDEINTLIDTQDLLGNLIDGFMYLEWNGSLQPCGG